MPAPQAQRQRVTAIILTKDEEEVLPRCLRELGWADEVLVVDSGSTDRTREVAVEAGARVEQVAWRGFAAQRNAGAQLAQHDWVFYLDADEVLDATLRGSVAAVLASDPDPRDAWAVDRRDEFWGELLPQAQRGDKVLSKVRLYHRAHSRWDEQMLVHEEVVVPGRRRLLAGTLIHWRLQTVAENAERIARYTAIEVDALRSAGAKPSVKRLVLLPAARFVWLYAVKGYYRRGALGYVNAVLRAHSDFLRAARLWEASRPAPPLTPPAELVQR